MNDFAAGMLAVLAGTSNADCARAQRDVSVSPQQLAECTDGTPTGPCASLTRSSSGQEHVWPLPSHSFS
jgi:hypothetical protein